MSIYLFLFYVFKCFACMYISTPYVCSAPRDQKKVSDPLELELGMAVSCHVGTWETNLGPLQDQPVLLRDDCRVISPALAVFILEDSASQTGSQVSWYTENGSLEQVCTLI